MAFVLIHGFVMASVASGPVLESIDVEPVWAGHPVGFCLYTYRDLQFVAYYDAERRMTVAVRKLNERTWHIAKLPEQLGWDSHNYVTFEIDEAGFIHLSGNMHVAPLVYYRTREPLDIDTFERATMLGNREDRCTYPEFLPGPDGSLIFTYRDGQSGSGDQLYNVYDAKTASWRRLLDTPLTSGQGKMNAYFEGPRRGPDGRFHLVWVWRDSPACETNHDVSYARSADLVHWETASGQPLVLPIIPTQAVVVDPVLPGGGMVNGNVRIGFDARGRVIISYHKFDESGVTQLYASRFEDGAWRSRRLSQWNYRWAFSGNGAIPLDIRVFPIKSCGNGKLEQPYRHVKYGSGSFIVEEATLETIDMAEHAFPWANQMDRVRGAFPGMEIRRTGDRGISADPTMSYVLQWETLGPNRDQPRKEPIPPPSMLTVFRVQGEHVPKVDEEW